MARSSLQRGLMAVALALGAAAAWLAGADAAAAAPTNAQLVGTRLMVAFPGTTAPAWLLARLHSGEVGGVILFGPNIASSSQLRALRFSLRRAANTGGQPPPLIAVDQEGGAVKRIGCIAPTLTPPQMGGKNDLTVTRNQGSMTGSALKGLGVNVNLAPVADTPISTSSFIYRQGRAFSMNPAIVGPNARAFAGGLESQAVAASVKHFPGLGRATVSTDDAKVTITATKAALQRD